MMEKQFYNEFSREFVALPSFLAKWHRIGFTEDDMIRLERELSANPKVGAVLKGTNGARKMRLHSFITAKAVQHELFTLILRLAVVFILSMYSPNQRKKTLLLKSVTN